MKKIFFYTYFLSLIILSFSCTETKKKNVVLTKEITFTKEGELSLKKSKTDFTLVTLDIEIADDEYQTQTGLMYRKSMAKNQAMLFIFEDEKPRSFYMKNTEIPLDIIYIDSKKTVVSIQKNAKPQDKTSLPSNAPAKYVLEVNAGLSDVWKLEVGDLMSYTNN